MNPLYAAVVAALAAGCFAGPACAITDGVTAQGLRFVTGGITDDERDALDANSEPHGLRVVTVTRGGGNYVADARVVIADDSGRRLLDARLDGPWLQVELQPGRYTVDAQFERQSLMQPVTIGANGRREMYFYFDADADAIPGAGGG